MKVFATAYGGDGTKYRSVCRPGIQSAAGVHDLVWAMPGSPGLAAVYNEFIRRAKALPGCEALILLHDDVELHDANLEMKVKQICTWPDVAVAGVIGGSGLRDGAWWTARTVQSAQQGNPHPVRTVPSGTDVDVVDGMFMVLTSAGLRHLSVDPLVAPRFHGYDTDLCLQARATGLRVVVTDVELTHHTKNTLGDAEDFYRVQHSLQRKFPHFIHRRTLREFAVESIARFRRRRRR